MSARLLFGSLFCMVLLLTPTCAVLAAEQEQKQPEQPEPRAAQDAKPDAPPPNGATDMNEMARAMTSMADMCRTMMQREMQSRPYVMVAGAIVGAIVVVALMLFIVLEIQWIRLLGVRIKAERKAVS